MAAVERRTKQMTTCSCLYKVSYKLWSAKHTRRLNQCPFQLKQGCLFSFHTTYIFSPGVHLHSMDYMGDFLSFSCGNRICIVKKGGTLCAILHDCIRGKGDQANASGLLLPSDCPRY